MSHSPYSSVEFNNIGLMTMAVDVDTHSSDNPQFYVSIMGVGNQSYGVLHHFFSGYFQKPDHLLKQLRYHNGRLPLMV
jgi:hypothetical protein